MLDERPMHGYELIGALEERSGGRWKPSPGSVYPALDRLEERGLITPVDSDDDTRRFEITDEGRAHLARHREAGRDRPWDDDELGRHAELRRAVAELAGPARQLARFGSADQIDAATTAVRAATSALYRILADGPADVEPDHEPDTDPR